MQVLLYCIELQVRQNRQNTIILMNIYPKNDNKMKKLVIIFIVISVSICGLYSQNKTIKGRVINEFLETTGMFIMINDTIKVGEADLDGFFQIEIPDSVKKILFKYVGIEQATIELADTCDEVEVVMMVGFSYDFMTPKKIDKLRMKRFKMLPELHKEAFEKGLFKTDKACYTQEFIPDYPQFWREPVTRVRDKKKK